MGKKKKKGVTPKKAERSTNVWDFLIHFTNMLYNLLTLEKITLVIMFVTLIIAVIQAIKTPFEKFIKPLYDLTNKIETIFNASIITTLLFLAFVIETIALVVMKKKHRKEIKAISNERSFVQHGIKAGTLSPLKIHHSSNPEELIKETYYFASRR